ncbi:MAG TPA: TadE/TadG family type IV pilus assembly protein [Nocardioidaceae bacterium]|nr:TadE/TadG family type IV pilus assembly protein [Nocardioidaceae bacterium]
MSNGRRNSQPKVMRLAERDERGAFAVIFAICMVLLFSIAAMAVDLGNAYTRKRNTQNAADFAALAGGSQLPVAAGSVPSASDATVQQVAQYLLSNWTPNDNSTPEPTQAELAACLTGGACANPQWRGSVTYGGALNGQDDQMTVVTPPAWVAFGFAALMGFQGTQVTSKASVGIFSPPGYGVMPVYATQACINGEETITDPATGRAPSTVPPLPQSTTPYAKATINQVYPPDSPPGLVPSTVNPYMTTFDPTNPNTGVQLTINGSKMAGVTEVGFFRETGSPNPPNNPVPYNLPSPAGFNANSVTVLNVPPAVLNYQGVWWVRVWGPAASGPSGSMAWSNPLTMMDPSAGVQPLIVGSALLQCANTPSEGNFGTLTLPRTDTNNATSSGWLPTNMALGLQCDPPYSLGEPGCLSLGLYPQGGESDPVNCDPSSPPSIYTDTSGGSIGVTDLLPGTNCVDTDTGLPANSATVGLITGGTLSGGSTTPPSGTFAGRLNHDTTPGCGDPAVGTSSRWDTGLAKPGGGDYSINNDILTCFFNNDTTTIDDVTKCSKYLYTGDPANPDNPSNPVVDSGCTSNQYDSGIVLDPSIYDSPRFIWVPVLSQVPTSGVSNHYSLVDFAPGFITDELGASTKSAPIMGGLAGMPSGARYENGLEIDNNEIETVKVIFFNPRALPAPERGPLTTYLGVGPKVVNLVN